MDQFDSNTGKRYVTNTMAIWVSGILRAVGASRWEDLKGRPCRVKIENEKIIAIGHYLKDIWFDMAEELKHEASL